MDLEEFQPEVIDMQGWIKLHRILAESDLWLSDKFSRGQAWVDLLLLANHRPGSVRVRGIRISLQRGDVGLSEVALSKRWRWSRGRVHRFLDELETDERISTKRDNKISVITILNYCDYQGYLAGSSTSESTADSTANGQQTDSKRTAEVCNPQESQTIHGPKNGKNEKNEKKKEKDSLSVLTSAVISYLNEKTGKAFRPTSDKTKALIQARVNEGFAEADFARAIDNMTAKWGNDPKMQGFLRPITLFSNKMESYVNESTVTDCDCAWAGAI